MKVGPRCRIGMVYEQFGGHVTFASTLDAAARLRSDVQILAIPLVFEPEVASERLFLVSGNWSVRASLQARRKLLPLVGELDAVLVHTQTAAHALARVCRGLPLAISVDATPINYDGIGQHYGHGTSIRVVEALKRLVVGRTLNTADLVIAWSEWVRHSLEVDYRVPDAQIALIPGGVELPPERQRRWVPGSAVRLVFIGRDFVSKGGEDLLAALDGLTGWELDVVTLSAVPPRAHVRVHNGMTPGDGQLESLLEQADAAVLPTRGDSSPFAVLEVMAAGLPVVSSRVGAVTEIIEEGVSGLLVDPGDRVTLRAHIAALLDDPHLRCRLGSAARTRVADRYQRSVNANRVLDEMLRLAVSNTADHRRAGTRLVSGRPA